MKFHLFISIFFFLLAYFCMVWYTTCMFVLILGGNSTGIYSIYSGLGKHYKSSFGHGLACCIWICTAGLACCIWICTAGLVGLAGLACCILICTAGLVCCIWICTAGLPCCIWICTARLACCIWICRAVGACAFNLFVSFL